MTRALRSMPVQLLVAQLVVGFAALVVNVLASRDLLPAGRGELALGVQLSYVLSAFVLLGADRAYPVASGAVDLRQALSDLGRMILPPCTLVVTGCVLVGLLLPPASGRLPYVLAVALLAAAGSAVVAVRAGAIASRRGGTYLASVVAGQGLLLTTSAGLLALPHTTALWWLLAYGIASAVPCTAVVLVERRSRARRTAPEDAPARAARVRHLRWQVAPSAIASLAMLRLDRLLVPLLASTRELGLYIVVATMTELLYWPIQHFVDSRVGRWREEYSAGTLAIRHVVGTCGVYLIVAGTVAGVAVWWSIIPLFGDEYAESRSLVGPLVAAACCYGASRVGVALCLATGRASRTMLSDGTGALLALALGVALIPPLGAMGAALASLAAYSMAAALSLALGCARSRSRRAA